MGTTESKAKKQEIVIATLEQVMAQPVKFKFEYVGVNKEDAIDGLQKICIARGMPPILDIEGLPNSHYCGIFQDGRPLTSNRNYYNPVFLGWVEDDVESVVAFFWWQPTLTTKLEL
jgi:hypothetical protein